MADLKPCPFCGTAARHIPFKAAYYAETAICDVCKVSAHVAIWNRRATEVEATGKRGVGLTDVEIALGHTLHRLRRDNYTGPSQLCDAFTAGVRYAESFLSATNDTGASNGARQAGSNTGDA